MLVDWVHHIGDSILVHVVCKKTSTLAKTRYRFPVSIFQIVVDI